MRISDWSSTCALPIYPAAAVLDADELHAGEAGEHAVADRRRERVLDGPTVVGHRGEGLRPEGNPLAVGALPRVEVALVAAVGGVQRDEEDRKSTRLNSSH